MQISPVIPVLGLILIAMNIVVSFFGARVSPTFMGIQLFLAGMTTIIFAVVDLINPVGISAFERALLFVSGCINCTVGYYMVLAETRR